MNKSILIIISLSSLLLNCSSSKSENKLNELIANDNIGNLDKSVPSAYFKSIQTKKIIPGYGIGLLKIEETKSKDLFDEKYTEEFYQKNGIDLQFRKGDTLTGIVLENDGNYYINSSTRIGLTENEIIKSIGKPKDKNIKIKKGQFKIGEMQSLNYQGFSIIFIDSKKSVISLFKNEP